MGPQDGTVQPKNKSGWVWIVLAVLLAVVALGVLWWWRAANQKPAATCEPENLTLSLGETERTDSASYVHAVLTNKGKTACTLEGYPIVSALDKKGENFVTSAAMQYPYYESQVVTLAPNGQAYAAVGVPDAGNFDPGVCSDASATLRLYLPAKATDLTQKPLVTDFSHRICPGFSVTVFRPGA